MIHSKIDLNFVIYLFLSTFITQFMIETLISSKTRLKLLLKFFLNSSNKSYLRSLEIEFKESTNAIRIELNRFEKAGLLQSEKVGNKKFFSANPSHPLFIDLQQIVKKHIGLDTIIENIVDKPESIERVYLTGKFAQGISESVMNFDIIGKVKADRLKILAAKIEKQIDKKISFAVYAIDYKIVSKKSVPQEDRFLVWKKG